jgi:Thrombospondin type 3 repeat
VAFGEFSKSQFRDQNTIQFPQEYQFSTLDIEFSGNAKLDIAEIYFPTQPQNPTSANLYFLAKPNQTYRVYTGSSMSNFLSNFYSSNLVGQPNTITAQIEILEPNPKYLQSDRDMDTVVDRDDNCPNVANTDQKDVDQNGIGDMCEDRDLDRILDGVDNCPQDSNPDQRDTDGDGIGDICDKTDSRILESRPYLVWGILVLVSLVILGLGVLTVKNKPKNGE